ncbi:VOC family protein [Amycolatopsis thermophila]|uniref:Catechol 2,3-dioxygenase-like lactoylglutathione lyase family enzyme n=1 Tax=Amycolatopsis thermophila TaxID=206084 RepID=A0ABU0EYB2_9PSEU|nr:VOC family protein [Amycolatopsis thermophila]MDQ0380310.1 catechol 2,3-dioxygenase-like lactoylglutathione lyase family enzyme [Amycolatopsis thermophila]
MSWGVISDMGSVTIRTSDIETSVRDAVGILGLKEVGRDGERVHLAAAGDRPELTYFAADVDGLDLLGLVAPTLDALHEVRKRIEHEGLPILATSPSQPGAEDGFSFLGPENFAFEVVVRPGGNPVQPSGFGPKRYGHFNFHPQDHRRMVGFLTGVLDFRVSDVIGTGGSLGYFLRCSSEHHGIAVLGGRGTLHHHAWETQSFVDLAKLGDRLHAHGRELLWAPVRHGAGQNLAAYYLEHSGNVVELYTDMEHIYDDDRPPAEWPDGKVWWNEWSTHSGFLPDGFRDHGLAPTTKR